MPEQSHTCIDPYLASFVESLSAASYKPSTIARCRTIIGKLGQVMDAEGIAPSALTPDLAERLGRMVPRNRGQTVCPRNPAREMIRLTTCLGHSDPSNTYWYLEAVPELLDLTMARATAGGREAVR